MTKTSGGGRGAAGAAGGGKVKRGHLGFFNFVYLVPNLQITWRIMESSAPENALLEFISLSLWVETPSENNIHFVFCGIYLLHKPDIIF